MLGGATQAATAWTADPAQSRLEFVATQAGGTFDGRFARFQAEIEFDPAELPAGQLIGFQCLLGFEFQTHTNYVFAFPV